MQVSKRWWDKEELNLTALAKTSGETEKAEGEAGVGPEI